MIVKTKPSFVARTRADALILPFFEGKKPAFKANSLVSLCGHVLKSGDFNGKAGEAFVHYSSSSKDKRVVLLGLGKEKFLDSEALRRHYGRALGLIKKVAKSVNVQLPEIDMDCTSFCVEGVLLANYTFDDNKSSKDAAPKELTFLSAKPSIVKEAKTLCNSVAMTRDLVFQNADVVTPTFLGEIAKKFAKSFSSITTTVMGRKEIEKSQMGLLQAVSRGALEEPAFIVVKYQGAPKSKDLTALVGKGVTYDTGGLTLKPNASMLTMRDDMGGAAVVLGTIHALCHLKIPVNVVAVIASTENSVGPNSYKIGDVYQSYSGKTVEITNADAEGRLVLADALSYVQKHYKPNRIIDLATLTGGAVVALGEEASALMANSDCLAESLQLAAEKTKERLCRLPLYEDYKQLLDSKIADVKNSGDRRASPIQGGIFLQHFIDSKMEWAHIDIAGTTFPESLKSYQPVQATGYGVRLLTCFFKHLI